MSDETPPILRLSAIHRSVPNFDALGRSGVTSTPLLQLPSLRPSRASFV